MALHSDYVEKIQQQAKRLDTIDVNTLDCPTLEKERILLCSALIKCADISNVVRRMKKKSTLFFIDGAFVSRQGHLNLVSSGPIYWYKSSVPKTISRNSWVYLLRRSTTTVWKIPRLASFVSSPWVYFKVCQRSSRNSHLLWIN